MSDRTNNTTTRAGRNRRGTELAWGGALLSTAATITAAVGDRTATDVAATVMMAAALVLVVTGERMRRRIR